MSWYDSVLKAVQPEDNPRGTIYGTIAAGLVIAAEDPARVPYPRVLVAATVAVASYWLAHGYADWVGERLRHRGDGHEVSVRQIANALRNEWPILEGGAIPIAALLVAWVVGVPLPTAITADLWTAAAALAAFEVAGGLRQHVRPARLLANVAVALVLATALFGVKVLLH